MEPTLLESLIFILGKRFEDQSVRSTLEQYFSAIAFFINSPNVAEGTVQAFEGTIEGFRSQDSFDELKNKLELSMMPGCRSVASNEGVEEKTLQLQFENRQTNFYFGAGGKRLNLALVKHRSL